MSDKKTALVVCPGRGTYNKAELGYLKRNGGGAAGFVAAADAFRLGLGRPAISALDGAASFSVATYSRGDVASPLIYASSYADFLAIDRSRIEIVAVTGNSMGWYTALACGGALAPIGALEVVDTMGGLMQETLIGGQIVASLVDEEWREIPGLRTEILGLVAEIGAAPGEALFVSIELGGMLVLAGTNAAIAAIEPRLPRHDERFPMRLANHAAFHTPLLDGVAAAGRARLGRDLFGAPAIAMIDGAGAIWWPGVSRADALYDYTLGRQVVGPYDFTGAIATAVREFAPDLVVVTGPGTTLGGAVAQSLIACHWRGLASKADFLTRQAADPLVVSMGIETQRGLVA
ncbi:MAG TPA: ACP S-malonyltransferase [Kaistiaceae bacterium]|nr:ACP S-malonyltransferase [Kaistiaceae bacterium]